VRVGLRHKGGSGKFVGAERKMADARAIVGAKGKISLGAANSASCPMHVCCHIMSDPSAHGMIGARIT
jgi:hypothetical protein